jgi:hypothetical protein
LSDFIAHNKDVLTFCIPLFGMLLTLCFGGVLNWRHKICMDYEGRRDVAINILQDRYVQKTSVHHTEIVEESQRDRVDIVEIYKRKKQREMIRELAATLEDSNKVKRYFRWLDRGSMWAFRSLWVCIPLTTLPLLSIWITFHPILIGVWAVVLVMALLLFVIAISLMSYLDGQFFRLVNRIIEPDEGE